MDKYTFLVEVKKIFPNANIDSINLGKQLYEIDFCWCYGEVSVNNYPDKYHHQIRLINQMARQLAREKNG